MIKLGLYSQMTFISDYSAYEYETNLHAHMH